MRYCVLEEIGSGGEGCLYLARDMELGCYRAVKEIPLDRKKEAKLLRLLEHPSMPQMIDYVENGGYCYLVMEYIRGKSLGQLQREGHVFSAEEILEYTVVITGILEYLHSQKPPVYYGDLKPDNLMLSDSGKLYLVDFGSAVFGYSKLQKNCMGTKGFAAPEQYEGKMDATSDIYALGKNICVLAGKNWYRILWQIPGLFFIVKKCTRRQEKNRYQSMAEVRKALVNLRKRKGQGRRSMAAAMLTAGLLVITGGILVYREQKPDFYVALTEVTQLYYNTDFTEKEMESEICTQIEKGLQKLQNQYSEKEAQRKLLLLLAANAELMREWEKAAVYYEQLLLYDSRYPEGYAKYGLFLLRRGLESESRRLWAAWEKNSGEELKEKSGTFLLWEAQLGKGGDR